MVCVFMSFVIGDDRSLKMFGLGLAVAVAIDAIDGPHAAGAGDDGTARRPQLVDPEVARPDPAEHRRRGSTRGAHRARGRARADPGRRRSSGRQRESSPPAISGRLLPSCTGSIVEPVHTRGTRHDCSSESTPRASVATASPRRPIFDAMHGSLVALVNQVVAVRYFGPNAFTFKTEVGRLAADFANRLHARHAGDDGGGANLDHQHRHRPRRQPDLDPSRSTPDHAAGTGRGRLRRRRHRRPRGARPRSWSTASKALRQGLIVERHQAPGHRLAGQRQAARGRGRRRLHLVRTRSLRHCRAVDHVVRPQPTRRCSRRRPLGSRRTVLPLSLTSPPLIT